MFRLFRIIFAATLALVFAISVVVSPTNAAAMLDCDVIEATVEEHAHKAADEHADHLAEKYTGSNNGHAEGHCAAHVCVSAVAPSHLPAESQGMWAAADHLITPPSLINLEGPHGLRRPPKA